MREKDIKEMIEGIKSLEKLSQGNLHHWRYVLENANSIWLKSPFNIGDRVRLIKTPEITEKKSWGWLGGKHYLIEGALAVVVDRQFYDGTFLFGLFFDDESWKDHEGKLHPTSEKGMYMFGERWLAPASFTQLTCEAL